MPNQDEPAYMLAARSNTRDSVPSSGYIVEKLLQRIDRLEKERAQVWDAGFTACNDEYRKQREDVSYPITRVNPYRT